MSHPRRLVSSVVVAGLIIVGTLPRPAYAQEKFQRHLNAAIRLYEGLEYERALTQLKLAADVPHNSDQEVELSLYEGIIQTDLGHQDEGTAAFKSALLVQPDAKLPVKVAPKVARLFESVRIQVQRELAAMGSKSTPQPPTPDVTAAPSSPDATTAATTVSKEAADRSSLRRRALIPAIAGGALVVAGGISWAVSRGELSRLRNNDSGLQSTEDVQHSVSRGKTFQTLGVALVGVGTAGLAAATGLYFLGAPQTPVSVGLTTDGTSAVVYGRWP
jgi:hypothetical protein